MQKTFEILAGVTKIIKVDGSALQCSLVVTPTGSTYTVSYTCHQSPEIAPSGSWVVIANMASATTQQTNEFGSISGFKIAVAGGTKVDVDILQPR
jgi:hypothetical protein